jgi:LysM repeat protein
MRTLREMSGGLIIAVVSLLLVLGGISLSLAENTPPEQPTPTPLPPIISTSIEVATFTPMILNTNTLGAPATETATQAFTSTAAPSATLAVSVVCNPPAGWFPIIVNANDTLYTIAERYKTTAEVLNTSNCLNNVIPAVGSRLYVPPVPTVTVIPCGPPAGWIKAYTVKPGDNLYRISLLYRTTVAQLQRANCMGSSTIIYAGQKLYVPNVPTSTPGVTVIPTFNTATPSLTLPPTATVAPTDSPSATTAPTNTDVPPTVTPSVTSFTSATPTTPSP